MKQLLLGLLVSAGLWCGSGLLAPAMAEPLTPEMFSENFARALRAALPSSARVAVTGKLELSIKDEAAKRDMTLMLINSYRDYSNDPKRFDQLVKMQAAAYLAPKPLQAGDKLAKIDPARIMPVIKDRQWVADNHSAFKARGIQREHVFDSFNADLVIVYAEDTPARMRYLMTGEDIGIARKELRARAISNFRRELPKIQIMKVDDALSIISVGGGDYSASLLLLDDIWSDGRIKVNGDIVVAVPARDVILVTGSRNREGLRGMRKIAADLMAKSAYRLTDTLFVYRNGRFARFGARQTPAAASAKAE